MQSAVCSKQLCVTTETMAFTGHSHIIAGSFSWIFNKKLGKLWDVLSETNKSSG